VSASEPRANPNQKLVFGLSWFVIFSMLMNNLQGFGNRLKSIKKPDYLAQSMIEPDSERLKSVDYSIDSFNGASQFF
jgi:hypothetical protein